MDDIKAQEQYREHRQSNSCHDKPFRRPQFQHPWRLVTQREQFLEPRHDEDRRSAVIEAGIRSSSLVLFSSSFESFQTPRHRGQGLKQHTKSSAAGMQIMGERVGAHQLWPEGPGLGVGETFEALCIVCICPGVGLHWTLLQTHNCL